MSDALAGNADALEQRLAEAFDSLWSAFVDPREAYLGDGSELWSAVGPSGLPGSASVSLPQLGELRDECRRLAIANEYAINGHENRISYIVGSGHRYRAMVRKGADAPAELAERVQDVLEEFRSINGWHDRQQEIIRRIDRDGEVFLRWFPGADGATRVRFIEPEQVATPAEQRGDENASHGVLTDSRDVETVIGYYVDGRLIDADEVQHRRANVDRSVKRGLPLYTPVRANLRRAERLLRNMSVVAEIQSAIALIRKHRSATRSGVEQFVADNATSSRLDGRGRVRRVTDYGPGTILDAPAGLEYDFPATGVDAANYVAILQAELRAIAARLVMPEFMFTSDASNANFASTMVAEGPAVKMFERLQAAMIEQDRVVMRRVVENAVGSGRLPSEALRAIEIQVTPPSVQVRDRRDEAEVDEIAFRHGVLSRQTWSQKLGLDYDQEQQNLRMDRGATVDSESSE